MPKVNVKWGAKLLDNVEVNLEESPLLLKAQLFELTDIPPDRQKLVVRGKTIGDDAWNGVAIKEGQTIMLIGGTGSTAALSDVRGKELTGSPNKSATKGTDIILPVGLKNLGNTCYMNATLQCFKTIPELDAAVKKYQVQAAAAGAGGAAGGAEAANHRPRLITNMLKNLYNDMDRLQAKNTGGGDDQSHKITPLLFLTVLHQTFPQFATQDPHGHLQQQDANECFCEVLRLLSDEVTSSKMDNERSQITVGSASEQNEPKIPLKKFFEIEYDVTLKCMEEGATEDPQKSHETNYQLSCFLSQEVRYIQSGIKSKMHEEIEKQSVALGRNARYQKNSLVSRLPAYLSVQIVRFFYKEKENISAKILKDVKFPIVLDLFNICSPELQEKMKPARQAIKEADETKVELERKAKIAEAGDAKIDLKPKQFLANTFADDPGSNNSGIYELKALITHKGRASNQGHYVAWVRVASDDAEPGTAKWAACDDDEVYPVSEEEILKLSGGGDWHCAYVLLYGPKKIPKY